MTKFKRLMCFFLVIVMMFALTACGKESGEKDEKEAGGAGAKVEDVKDIYDAIALAGDYTKGDYKVEISFDADVEGTKASGSISASGKIDGKDMTTSVNVDVNADGTPVKLVTSDLVTVKGDKAYIDIDAIIKAATDTDTSLGAFVLPLPDVDESAQKDYQKKAQDLSIGLLKAMFDGVEVSQNGNTYTIELKTGEQYLAAINGMIDYISANKNAFNDLYKSSYSSVDTEEYLNTLIDFYRDDIKELVGQVYEQMLGQSYEISDEEMDEMIKQMKQTYAGSLNTSGIENFDIFEEIDFDELKQEINSVSAEDFQAAIDEAGLSVKFSVTAEEDKYVVDGTLGMEFEGDKVEMSLKYTFEAASSVSISTPSKIASLTDVYQYFMQYAGSLGL